jgi:tryptophanyl-tRNA synthetase
MNQPHTVIAARPRTFTPRVLTGDRPTGRLHLGHLFGTLENRVRLQDEGLEVFVVIADYQTITDRDSPASLPEDVLELVADYLAVGIDPDRTTIFAHSVVPELNQLLVPFLSLVTLPELLRNPTVETEAASAGMRALNGLMLTYPVHQAADILFCRATLVPVGVDQLPHVEQTRLIARRFNRRYAPDRPVFPEPEAMLGDAPVLLGTDGHKMSKSCNNAIALAASADQTARLLRGAKTDCDPHITYDPKHRPEVSNLVLLTAMCEGRDPSGVADEIGGRGAAELKRRAIEAVNERLAPVRERRADLAADRAYLRSVVQQGSIAARSRSRHSLRSPEQCTPTTDQCVHMHRIIPPPSPTGHSVRAVLLNRAREESSSEREPELSQPAGRVNFTERSEVIAKAKRLRRADGGNCRGPRPSSPLQFVGCDELRGDRDRRRINGLADRIAVLVLGDQEHLVGGLRLGLGDARQAVERRRPIGEGVNQIAGAVEDRVGHRGSLRPKGRPQTSTFSTSTTHCSS